MEKIANRFVAKSYCQGLRQFRKEISFKDIEISNNVLGKPEFLKKRKDSNKKIVKTQTRMMFIYKIWMKNMFFPTIFNKQLNQLIENITFIFNIFNLIKKFSDKIFRPQSSQK